MKQFDVHISNSLQRGIRRRCVRRYPNEYGEAMFVRRSVGEFHIEKFIKIRLKGANSRELEWDELEYQAVKNQCTSEGFEFATIHSHPDSDSSPSTHDHKDGTEGEVLIGIVGIKKDKKTGKFRTYLDFWVPQLPCHINLIRN
jgi:proteasome lid subunit RPN8/RPN11